MKNTNIKNQSERVEVMALFNYSQTPCQPLRYRRRDGREIEVTELVRASVQFAGMTAKHVFDVLVGSTTHRLEFDSATLVWTLTH